MRPAGSNPRVEVRWRALAAFLLLGLLAGCGGALGGGANAGKSPGSRSVADGQVGRGCRQTLSLSMGQYPTPVAGSARDRQSPSSAEQNGKPKSTGGAAGNPGPPAPRPPAEAGPGWEVISVRREADRVTVSGDDQAALLVLTSPSGIGAAELCHRRGAWPRELRIRLVYAEAQPFRRLEGFAAELVGEAGTTVLLKTGASIAAGAEGVVLTIPLPSAPARPVVLRLSWVDMYR